MKRKNLFDGLLTKTRTIIDDLVVQEYKQVHQVDKNTACAKQLILLISAEARKQVANKIETDMPTITRYGALQYIRDLWQALKEDRKTK